MYPRNSASPEPIAIGPVVQISDGAVQTSGVTVRVKPIGVAEADGGGTTDYSTDGVVLYTPTQAETNYTSFVLIAKKTGCIPASVTVVTSARSVTGEVQVGGYAAGQSPPSANNIRDAVMNADPAGGWADGSFGDRWLISASNTRQLAITGSGHIAAVLHDAEPNSIPEDAFFTDAFSARVLAADFATEIATAVGNLQVLSRLDSMIESDGNGQFRFDTIALSMAAGGAGGTDWTANERTAIRSILGIPASGTTPADPSVGILDTIRDGVNSIGINVYPVTSSTPERVNGTTITVYKDEQTNVTISTTATLTGLTLRFVAEDRTGADVLVVENASFVARTATSATLQIPSTLTDEIANYPWTLRDVTTGNSVLARGVLSVQAAASKNA